MEAYEFVRKSVYDGALEKGCVEYLAKIEADKAVKAYKENRFKKVSELIKKSISDAVKLSDKVG